MSQNSEDVTLSVVVVIYNMERECKRTLHSLSSSYQEGIGEKEYEVIVVDNGSSIPLDENYVKSFGPNFKYFYIEDAPPSPAWAINYGVSQSKGTFVGIIIDGARMLTPRVLKYALHAFHKYQQPVVCTLAWHLGPDIQFRSIQKGYDQTFEDRLLTSISWPENGYRLFDISVFAMASKEGWFGSIYESNCMFVRREMFDELGGYEEKFYSPGGGWVNHDMFQRICELPDTEPVYIIGEGNFHQIHGGIATNSKPPTLLPKTMEWSKQYSAIRNRKPSVPGIRPRYVGHIPRQAVKWIVISMLKRLKHYVKAGIGNRSLFKELSK